jgi:hypothetical protein
VDEIGRSGVVVGNPIRPFEGLFPSGSAAEGTLDVDELGERLAAYRESARMLLRAEAALSIHMFLILPIVWTVVGIGLSWPYLLGGLLVLHVAAIAAFLRTHHLALESSIADRLTATLPLFLAPPMASVGHVAITKHLVRDAHPVAAAFLLCDDDRFRELAAVFLRRVEFPARADQADSDPADTPSARLDEMRALISRRLGSPETLLAHPGKQSETAQGYCPRCLAEYSHPEGTCSECEGVPLKQFA